MSLLSAFPSYGMDVQGAKDLTALYVRALDEAPTWAISAASARFLKGRAKVLWDGVNRPSPPQFVGECKHLTLPVEAEIHDLSVILDALVVETETTEDERKAALAHWETLKREILSANGTDAPKNLQAAGLRETNDREKLKEHARLAAAGETLPVSPDGLTISTALRESNRRYAAERGIRQPQEA